MMLSIIIPIYNSEKSLPTCVESVLAQSFSDFELLLVDDGSTDSSGAFCDKIAESDHRVRAIHQKNGGPSKARNTGIDASSGEYILCIDSDDLLLPGALECITKYLAQYEIDILKFGYAMESENMKKEVSCSQVEYITEPWKMLDRTEGSRYCGFVWNTVFRRNCIGKNRFREDLRWCEDHLFSFECFRQAKAMLLIPDILYSYKVGHTNQGLSVVHDPYAVYEVAQAELPIKLSMVDNVHTQTIAGIWNEYYGKLNLAVKILFWENTPYKKILAYKNATKRELKGLAFPQTCKHGHIFYNWPFLIAFLTLKLKVSKN